VANHYFGVEILAGYSSTACSCDWLIRYCWRRAYRRLDGSSESQDGCLCDGSAVASVRLFYTACSVYE